MKNEELRCPLWGRILTAQSYNVCHCEGRQARGNPYSVQEVHTRTNCQKDGLPRRLRLLAMTEEIEAQAQTIDHICHCEAPQGPWQSVLRAGSAHENQLPKEQIAASHGLLAMTGDV